MKRLRHKIRKNVIDESEEIIEDLGSNNLENRIVKDNKKKIYLGYYQRLIIMLLLLLVLLGVSSILFINSLNNISKKEVNYSESGNLDYKVYLKENNFYDDDYLNSGMAYVANIIKSIDVDFNYIFKIDKDISANFYYDVVGKLVIMDSSEENTFFTKEYTLLDTENEGIKNGSRFDINRTITIDYDYYNKLAQDFKDAYGVDTVSNLIVTLRVNKLSDSNYKDFNTEKNISLKIPLTTKAVNIKMEPVEVVNNKQVLNENEIKINNNLYFGLAIVLFLISLVMIYRIIRHLTLLMPRKSLYQRKLNKILRCYDRLIANVRTLPDFSKYQVIKVEDFYELVDIRDNLKQPIMYFNVKDGEKCYFYIESYKKFYLFTLKAVDLEKKDEKN
jgi:hypothetical protein